MRELELLIASMLVALALAFGIWVGNIGSDVLPLTQDAFPCAEDESLQYINTPDKESTGCVPLDGNCEVITHSFNRAEGEGHVYTSKTTYIGNCNHVPTVY